MTITVSRTKGGLRISWEPGDLPFSLGQRVAHRVINETTIELFSASNGVTVYQAFGRHAARWSKTDAPLFSPVNGYYDDGTLTLGSRDKFRQVTSRRHHEPATTPVTVDDLKRTLTQARDTINRAKDQLGDDMNINVVDGKLRIILMMEI